MANNYFTNGENQQNQTNQPNQTNTRTGLTNAQVYLLELYSSQYNEIMRQINARYREANEIRNMMNLVISQQTQSRQTQPQQQQARQNNLDTYTNYALNSALNSNRNSSLRSDAPYSSSNLLRTFFNSVPITPSAQQITRATRQCQFLEIADPPNERCPISLELFRATDTVTQIIYCEHLFNPGEITTWFRSNVVCPVCRYDIRNYTPNAQNNPSNSETKEETEAGEESKDPDGAVIREQTTATSSASDNLTQLLLNVISESITTPSTVTQQPNARNQVYSLDPSDNVYLMEFLFRY